MASTSGAMVALFGYGETTSAAARTSENGVPTAIDQFDIANMLRSLGASPTDNKSDAETQDPQSLDPQTLDPQEPQRSLKSVV